MKEEQKKYITKGLIKDFAPFMVDSNNRRICEVSYRQEAPPNGLRLNYTEESRANAELICETFNTFNETGLTPAELVEQNENYYILVRRLANLDPDGNPLDLIKEAKQLIKEIHEQRKSIQKIEGGKE